MQKGLDYHDERIRSISIQLLGDFLNLNLLSGEKPSELEQVLVLMRDQVIKYADSFHDPEFEPYMFISILYMIIKWIPYLNLEGDKIWNCVKLAARLGMKHSSHFIQTQAIDIICGLYKESHYDICLDTIKYLMDDVSYCETNRITLLQLTESLANIQGRNLILDSNVAIRNVWAGLRDTNSMISQYARAVLKKIIEVNMEQVLLLDVPNKEDISYDDLLIDRLNQQISYLLIRSNKMSAMNSIRIVSCLISDKQRYNDWVVESLSTLLDLFTYQEPKYPSSPFITLKESLLDRYKDAIQMSLLDVLINLLKNNFEMDYQPWINYYIQSTLNEHKEPGISSQKLAKIIKFIINSIGNVGMAVIDFSRLAQFVMTMVNSDSISWNNKENILNIAVSLFEAYPMESKEAFSLLPNYLLEMSKSTEWEVRDNSIMFLIQMMNVSGDKPGIEDFIVSHNLTLIPFQLIKDKEIYVRRSSMICLELMFSSEALISILLNEEHDTYAHILQHCHLEEDPQVRLEMIKLIKQWISVDSIRQFLVDQSILGDTSYASIKKCVDDDDWEVRREYYKSLVELLSEVLDNENAILNEVLTSLDCENSIYNATDDPIRAVRYSAWEGLEKILTKSFTTSPREGKPYEVLISNLKAVSISEKLREQKEKEVYDEDDDVYPLEPSFVENDMDCPF